MGLSQNGLSQNGYGLSCSLHRPISQSSVRALRIYVYIYIPRHCQCFAILKKSVGHHCHCAPVCLRVRLLDKGIYDCPIYTWPRPERNMYNMGTAEQLFTLALNREREERKPKCSRCINFLAFRQTAYQTNLLELLEPKIFEDSDCDSSELVLLLPFAS